jgi:hypothetical protein
MRIWYLFFVVLLSFGADVASAQTIDVSDLHGGLVMLIKINGPRLQHKE